MEKSLNKMTNDFFKFVTLYVIGVIIFYMVGVRDILYIFGGVIVSMLVIGMFFRHHRRNYFKTKNNDDKNG